MTFDFEQYDLHTHSNLSDGRDTVDLMVKSAWGYGMKGLVLSDHAFNDEQARHLLQEYGAYRNATPVILLRGVETCVKDTSGLAAVSEELLARFDWVLMDCNNLLFRQLEGTPRAELPERLTQILCRACSVNPRVRVMAHPFNFGLSPLDLKLTDFTDDQLHRAAEAFVQNRKIFEIMNQMCYWHQNGDFGQFHRDYLRVVKVFREAGAYFTLGSDTHSCCGIGNFSWSLRVVRELDLADRVVLPDGFDPNRQKK